MVACEFSLLLSAYHDGELDEAQQRQVEAHLQTCPACVAELEQWRSLSSLLATSPVPPASFAFIRRLEGSVREPRQLMLLPFVRRWTAAAAALLVAAMCYSVLMHKSDGPSETAGLATWERTVIAPDRGDTTGSTDAPVDLIVQGFAVDHS
jgi:anti-sigma factor RsiW